MGAPSLCIDCLVRDQSLCASLTDAELIGLNSVSRHRSLPQGTTLLWAGEDSIICGNLISGVLKMTAAASDGREQIVGLLYPADFFGRAQAGEMQFSVTALIDSELCVFPRERFQRALEDHVRMERALLRRTLDALDEARGRMLLLARGTAEERVSGFLLQMANRAATQDNRHEAVVELPLSRGQIADVLGLTIETVSRQISRLKLAGVIALPGGRQIAILDRPALERRAVAA